MRTAELTGAMLDYWTARAEGAPAADLELRAAGTLCVRVLCNGPAGIDGVMVLDYSTNWALCGPLLRKYILGLDLCIGDKGAYARPRHRPCDGDQSYGDTELIAICRAVVRAAFGDEVEDLPCA